MAFPTPPFSLLLSCGILLILLAHKAEAFGAGNIASTARIEGQNWRHGDIEDTLLTLLISRAAGGGKFSKLDVKRVYFGNWLRDYSQAVDVGTVKYVSAEAIRIILWVLGFLSFGYGTKEFEVTTDRLGCYRPEEHIDNPKDYADNIDARQYDRRLRGPVDERRELSINPQTGLKNYIASESIGITTSAGLIRDLFGRSIQFGRQYARSQNKADLFEALRLLGTGCHCLEDYSAHSNYTELALIELGEREVFPHVGRQTKINLPGTHGPVYPLGSGTFGSIDFLHSVMGEFSDKATQSEIQELEGTIQQSQDSGQGNVSMLQSLLSQVPSGLFGGKDQAGKADELQMNAQAAQMQNTHITPRQPEQWTQQLEEVSKQIYPILEWHDEIMQSITETIENIPMLPDLVEQIQDQINIFVFSLLAPFILPIINQVKTELATGSSEIIESSREKQHIVFRDDRSSDPTHSMLSKDHFSNVLNEPAGKVASQVLKWVVPQLIACWDDERIDVDRTLTRIVNGVFHHPALRNYGDDGAIDGRRLMFGVMQQWWGQKEEYERAEMRQQLSREGVEQGRNHKEGAQDSGHGCGKPLGMPTTRTAGSSGAIGGPAAGAVLGGLTQAFGGDVGSGIGGPPNAGGQSDSFGKLAGEAVGGGALGGLVGGLVGGIGGDLLGDAFGGSNDKKEVHQQQRYEADGSYTQTITETGRTQFGGSAQRYGQAEYSQTAYPGGGYREEVQRYEQDGEYGRSGHGEQIIRENRPTYGGGYEQTTETTHERLGGGWESEVRREGRGASGEFYAESKHHEGHGGYRKDSDSEDEYKKREKKQKHKKKHHDEDSESDEEKRQGYGQQSSAYGQESRRFQQDSTGYEARSGYGEERHEFGQGYGSQEGQGFVGERRYRGGRPAHESEGIQGGSGDERYGVEGRPAYDAGYEEERPTYGETRAEAGFEPGEEWGRREEHGRRREAGQEEGYGGGDEDRGEEEFGVERGYGQADEYQERRGYGEGY
ncbi:MAG: hypothetical protein M1830_006181 [Pleopsidium flavum]|nr:MAG: hypothetical protein M1830_006181 [Pleopsidium flavum]